MSPERAEALRTLVESWLTQRQADVADVTVLRAEVLRPGRPGLLDIVARVGRRRAHLVAGVRAVADEPHFLSPGEDSVLGLLEDDEGLGICTDALRDAQLAPLLLATVRGVAVRAGSVAVLRDDERAWLRRKVSPASSSPTI